MTLKELIDSNLVSSLASTLMGLIGGVVGYLLSERRQFRKTRAEEDNKYVVLLKSIKYEIEFYIPKLRDISQQVTSAQTTLKAGGRKVNLPSYTLYTETLGNAKQELNRFFRHADLVHLIGTCHFELGHAKRKLELVLERQAKTEAEVPAYLDLLKALDDTVQESIKQFSIARDELEQEITAITRN